MDFPLADLMDEDACYAKLIGLLHPGGLACPRCGADERLGVHRRHRAPVLDYQCGRCRRVFNAWTGTALQGVQRRPSQIVLILRGIAQGVPTAQLARELGCDRMHLLDLRHRLQERAQIGLDRNPLGDASAEADECYVNAGEKSIPHDDPADPPRRRANGRRGHGTFANDRPPVAGVVGRESGEARVEVVDRADGATLEEVVACATLEGSTVYTDEWQGYNGLAGLRRDHVTVSHAGPRREWARDDDGDGVREAHVNTTEGHWTGLRTYPRPFRGVSKWYLGQYVAVYEWGHRIKRVTDEFLRTLLGMRPGTGLAS